MPPSIESEAMSSTIAAELPTSNPTVPCSSTCSRTSNNHFDLLGLFLGTNNDKRLDSSVWDYLTLRDLYQLRSVSKSTNDALDMVEYNRCRDGKGEHIMKLCVICHALNSVFCAFFDL